MNGEKKLLIISPILFGSGSGAATYYKTLAEGLLENGISVSFLTDRENPVNDDERNLLSKIKVIRLFPKRSLRKKNLLIDIVKYAIQNIQYFFLPFFISRLKCNVIIIHSSFLNHLTTFNWVLILIFKKFSNKKIIFDVRDRGIKSKYIPLLKKSDCIIACSLNVLFFLKNKGVSEKKIVYIPIIQQLEVPDDKISKRVLDKYGLSHKNYLLYGGLIKKDKRVDELLKAFQLLKKNSEFPFTLVIAGLLKEEDKEIEKLLNLDGVEYVGNINHKELLSLMLNAKLSINISRNEGLPRSSLEAITLKSQVILPPEVPEFYDYCPNHVYRGDSLNELVSFIEESMGKGECIYPIEMHSKSVVLKKYMKLI